MLLPKWAENLLPNNKIDVFGKDSLVMNSAPYYLLFFTQLFAIATIQNHAWAMMVIVYALLPLMDEIFTQDLRNPTEQERRTLQSNDLMFRICLYVTMALDWVFFFKMMRYFTQFEFSFWGCYNLVALFFIFSNINSVQFVISHQFFHKTGFFDRTLGTLHMSKNLYMHATYEHLFGHHRTYATPEDASFARQGQSVYTFFPRTLLQQIKNVYRMQKDNDHKPFFLNYAVLSIVSSISFIFAIYHFYNMQTAIFFVLEAVLSVFYLETINYIEHYGLLRQKLANGKYQKATIRHSWNAPHRISNYLLFKLQRHSDHHQNSLKPYQTLISHELAPQLPHGYSLIIFLSFFPSEWNKVMDPLVDEYKQVRVGIIRNELNVKAISDTRKFAFKLGSGVTILWLISYLQYL